jgi:hypothetical protein
VAAKFSGRSPQSTPEQQKERDREEAESRRDIIQTQAYDRKRERERERETHSVLDKVRVERIVLPEVVNGDLSCGIARGETPVCSRGPGGCET